MPEDGGKLGTLRQIVVAVVIALVAGSTAPWWWRLVFPGPKTVAPDTGGVTSDSAESTADASGRTVDKTDYPFVDDPSVVGTWRAVDFVPEPDSFSPGHRSFVGELALVELRILHGGRTSMAWRWTRGMLLNDADHTASRYRIRALGGRDYMFFEWKSGDYVFRHQRPSWYVLQREG